MFQQHAIRSAGSRCDEEMADLTSFKRPLPLRPALTTVDGMLDTIVTLASNKAAICALQSNFLPRPGPIN